MNKDTHKGILGIHYNSLNLPTELAIKNINTSGKTYYTYSASGVKLRTEHKSSDNLNYTPVMGTSGDNNFNETKVTDYAGNIIYEDEGLKRILVDGGYIENGKYIIEYQPEFDFAFRRAYAVAVGEFHQQGTGYRRIYRDRINYYR